MYAYNPRKKSFQQLEKSLVGKDRWDVLNSILKELSLKKGESPKQHWMVVGPRGIGKSHLLSLLYYKIANDDTLRNLWIPVLFPEEIRMAGNLAKFLERAVREICQDLEKTNDSLVIELKSKIDGIKKVPSDERTEYLFSILTWIHTTTGRYILLITENLQQLLGKRISVIEQKKLRAYLQTEEAVLLIGSATTVFDALHDHSHPFYHFFHISRLEDLSFDDLKSLVVNLLTDGDQHELAKKVTANEARIRALYSFTGGNPRIAVFLADMLKADMPDEMMSVMDKILDEMTPYFEAILSEVPHYQEEILNTLAAYEPAQSPKDIAGHLEVPQPTVRNYLKHLKENGYVRVAFSKGKYSYYCLKEYLYRIWYQMRDSSHREESRWLMELLLMLYSPTTIIEEKKRMEQGVSVKETSGFYSTMISKAASFIAENPDYSRIIELCIAATGIYKEDPLQMEKLFKTINRLIKNNAPWKALKILTETMIKVCAETLVMNSPEERKLFTTINESIKNKDAKEAIKILYELITMFITKVLTTNLVNDTCYFLWGCCLEQQKQYEEAIEKFTKAADINPQSEDNLLHWGECLKAQQKYEEAIDKFKMITVLKPDSYAANKAWGDCLRELNKHEEAEQMYLKAIEINPQYEDAYLAWGQSTIEQGRYDDAIKKFQQVLKINPKSDGAYMAWAEALVELKEYDKAIRIYEGQLSNNKNCVKIYLYGKTLFALKRFHKASAQFKKLIDLDFFIVCCDYGLALEKMGRKEEALVSYLTYLHQDSKESVIDLNYQKIFNKYIAPLIVELKPEDCLKQFYTQEKDGKFSRPVLATLLLMLGKYDVINEHVADIITVHYSESEKKRQEIELFIFTIKLCIWLKLSEGKMYEVLRPLELFIQRVKLLQSTGEKEKEVSDLILSLFKLQIHMKVAAGSIRETLNAIRTSGVPFNEVFIKVWTCISEPDSVDAQKYLNEKAIGEIVAFLKETAKPTASRCGELKTEA